MTSEARSPAASSSEERRELLARLLEQRIRGERAFPVSFAQRRLWFLHQMLPQSPAYNVPVAVRLRGELDVERLGRALEGVVRRHAVLRTTFAERSGEPMQVVAPEHSVELAIADVTALAPGERWGAALASASEEASLPFDLERGPLLRPSLYRLGDGDHLLLLACHHLVMDAWSIPILFAELEHFYAGAAGAAREPLPELTLHYGDYARWEREALSTPEALRSLAYWREQLGGELSALALPTDRPRPAVQSYRGAWTALLLEPELTADLRSTAARERVTFFTLLAAAFAALLHRHTGAPEVPVGVPVSVRDHAATQSLVGMFVNTVVLRLGVDPELSFRALLERTRETLLGALEHRATPFERVVEELRPDRELSHTPLFQVLFEMESEPPPELRLEGLEPAPLLGPEALHTRTAKTDLAMALQETAGGLEVGAEYSTDLFRADSVGRLLRRYERLLREVAHDPGTRVGSLPILPEVERRSILEWSSKPAAPGPDRCVHEVFAEQVRRAPERVALAQGSQSMSYAELDARADLLAHRLRSLGVETGDVVAVCIERSTEMVVALLAALKAGAAYLPLDPGYPEHRLRFMLEDAAPRVVLAQRRSGHLLAGAAAQVLCLDQPDGGPEAGGAGAAAIGPAPPSSEARAPSRSVEAPSSGATPRHAAYVMYTSGSTGVPKASRIPHRAVVRLVVGVEYVEFGADDTVLQLTSISFDPSTMEIWGALLHGARLVIPAPHTPTLEELEEVIAENRISILHLSTSLFHQLVERNPRGLDGVRQIVVGGDVLSPAHLRTALARRPAGGRIVNGYGPTECAMLATCHAVTAAEQVDHSVPIGRPIESRQVLILDRELELAPIGVPGEIHLGGEGLALDYLGRPQLTAERFLPHPLSREPGERLYRTGDHARWLADGTVEFLGRRDRQVKIRGFRVELGEIEAVLAAHPAVVEAAVQIEEAGPSDQRLVAYVERARDAALGEAELRDYARERLPRFMVPSFFAVLDELPRTPNGKIDRGSLRRPAAASADRAASPAAPEPAVAWSETERQIAEIWRQVLGVERIERDDNFFDLGGHSLLLLQVFSRLHQLYGRRVSVIDLFRYPTVTSLAGLFAPRPSAQLPVTDALEPLFFGARDGRLYGCYHAPAPGTRRETAILVCQPIGHEYVSFHRACRQLADALAETGFPVLRFDYYGCGDSAGRSEEGSFERWLDDTDAAAAELRARSGRRSICLVGLRLGASLAYAWSVSAREQSGLVLWDPVLDGDAFARGLEGEMRYALRKAHVSPEAALTRVRPSEALGFPMPAELWRSLEAVRLDGSSGTAAPRVLLIDTAGAAAGERLERALRERGGTVELARDTGIGELWSWSEDLSRIQLPERLLRRVVDWCAGSCP